jgi:hypothetical protein
MTSLCKVCFHYNQADWTCARSVVGALIRHDHAKSVRADTARCGPNGKWFTPVFGKDGLKVDEMDCHVITHGRDRSMFPK